jgi:DNA repair exonuclease SbcCD ATPase subunit
MRKNRGIIAEVSSEAIKKVIEVFSLKAFADEGEDNKGADTNNTSDEGGNTQSTPTINYEDLIAKARKEEKEKQYKSLEKLKGQVNTLTEQHNNDLLKIADLEKQLQEAKEKLTTAGSGDSEEVKTLKETVKTLTADKEALDKKVKDLEANKPVSREEVEAEVRAELEAEYEVKTYKAEKMAELKDDILVPELVFGNTKEEIDSSIQSALERSEAIRKSLGVSTDKKQKRTPKSPANPSVSGVQDKEISLERLATMDVRSSEYAELRKQLGLR